jgi:hypothetical protein
LYTVYFQAAPAPALDRANKLRLRGGRPFARPPEQFQSEIAPAYFTLEIVA